MSQPWKLLPLAAIAALGAFVMLTGSDVGKTKTVFASDDPKLIVDVDTSPAGGVGYLFDFEVDATEDDDSCIDDFDDQEFTLDDGDSLTIECTENDTDDDDVEIEVNVEVPDHSQLEDVSCSATDIGDTADDEDFRGDPADGDIQSEFDTDPDFDDDGANFTLTIRDSEHIECAFDFDFDEDELETPTPEIGDAATVIASASPNEVNCNGTSIVTIQVRDENGQAVAVGTEVQIAASFGEVSPSTGQTTGNNGSAFTFYTAPSDQGGDAVITATSDGASGQTTIEVDCAQVTPTTAAPPTVVPGVISPPSTGDAGLAGSGSSWQPFAGLALVAASIIAATALTRVRA